MSEEGLALLRSRQAPITSWYAAGTQPLTCQAWFIPPRVAWLSFMYQHYQRFTLHDKADGSVSVGALLHLGVILQTRVSRYTRATYQARVS